MVNIFVGVADKAWFDFLSGAQPDEVNFWAPSGRTNFRALQPGELFLFKLHAPNNFIVGGGVFSSSSNLPLSIAWDAFGAQNGVPSLEEMRRRIVKYRNDPLPRGVDPTIGCRVLTSPFFWPREQWIPVPESWSRNIVVGRSYDTQELEGARLWSAVVERAAPAIVPANQQRYGMPAFIRHASGKGHFGSWLPTPTNVSARCRENGHFRSWMPRISDPTPTVVLMKGPTAFSSGRTSISCSTWVT